MTVRILKGDCREVLRTMEDESVHCVVTSPPYWGLRDYGVDGQIGLEPTPENFVSEMVSVFREVRRVLRADGTCWLNLGDSYMGGGRGGGAENCKQRTNVGSLDAAPNQRVAGYKQHLREKRYIAPLFDAERFCHHLEHAYELMAERAKQGLGPDHIDVPALPPRTEPFGSNG